MDTEQNQVFAMSVEAAIEGYGSPAAVPGEPDEETIVCGVFFEEELVGVWVAFNSESLERKKPRDVRERAKKRKGLTLTHFLKDAAKHREALDVATRKGLMFSRRDERGVVTHRFERRARGA